MSVEATVLAIIEKHSPINESKFKEVIAQPDTPLNDALGFDSLDVLELTMALEHEFNIQIDDDMFDKWNTVKDVIETVVALVDKKAA